ncbi:hypothetical protein I4F81_006984 [Pyropia yezoensis]|uniref:Uncharacterized protein n=1 Tax=Pyropia yezoensis TaxID=2788 RepID=A0ACC3C3S0_PYRYE|nr:hypothetical protein I4F81_006984 [Neopyropia yezoensis]
MLRLSTYTDACIMGFAKATAVAVAAVGLCASAAAASAANVTDAVSRPSSSYYRGLGASCSRVEPCSAANLVCVNGTCGAAYVAAGKPCGGRVRCYRNASCDAGV